MNHYTRSVKLSQALVGLADTLVHEFDVVDFVQTLSDHCVDLFDLTSAGVMLHSPEHGSLQVLASSDEKTHALELLEVQSSQGPCLDAFTTGEPIQATADEADRRWPAFAARAQAKGYYAVGAVPMRLRAQTVGAMNLLRTTDVVLTEDEIREAQALADIATIGLLNERALRESRMVAEQLQHALNSRVVLEQAKGVLAAKMGSDVDKAFTAMRRYARNHNLKLSQVAEQTVAGQLPVSLFT